MSKYNSEYTKFFVQQKPRGKDDTKLRPPAVEVAENITSQFQHTNIIDAIMTLKLNMLRVSVGVVYCWFGGLKFFPHPSEANDLAVKVISWLTYDSLSFQVSILLLAIVETLIGIALILNFFPRTTIVVAIGHMAGTFIPLVLFPDVAFSEAPLVLTLMGQYILKNVIIVFTLLCIYPFKINALTDLGTSLYAMFRRTPRLLDKREV